MKKTTSFLVIVTAMLFVATSCRITKPYTSPTADTDGLYRDVTTSDTATIATLPYTQLFTDTILQNLIARGIARSPDLLAAYTRIQQAEAAYLQSRVALAPTLNANTGVTANRLSNAQGFGIRTSSTIFEIGLSSSWEADIWGRLRSNRRANFASLLQSQAAAKAVQTGLVATIANYYFTLLALDQQLVVTRQTVVYWDTTVQTLRALKIAARVTEAAVVQSEAQRYAAEVTIPDLLQNIKSTENALSVLIGSPPAAIARTNLTDQTIPFALQTGVPAQLLSNRPDVQAAELAYRFAFELTNVARASFYPTVGITSNIGLSSLGFGNLLRPGAFGAGIGPAVSLPIFGGRVNRSRLEIAQAQQQESLINFQNTLLTAGQEVSDALALYQAGVDKAGIRTYQVNALTLSVSYTQELLRNGFATYVEVIQAQQSLLQARLNSINDRLQQLQASVNLYRALGGGWR